MRCRCGQKVERTATTMKLRCSLCKRYVHCECYDVGVAEYDFMQMDFKCDPCRKERRTSLLPDGIVVTPTNSAIAVSKLDATASVGSVVVNDLPTLAAPNINLLNSAEVLCVIDSRMDEIKNLFKDELKRHSEKIVKLESIFVSQLAECEKQVMCSIRGVVSEEVAKLRTDIAALNMKCDTLTKRCVDLEMIVDEQKSIINTLENNSVASDIVIANMPNNVNIATALNHIFSTLECNSLPIVKAFRIKSRTPDKSEPIIVKFASADVRVSFFRALANFCKTKKRQLQLADAGLDGANNIYIHECLSSSNKQLLNAALAYKRNNTISNVFTIRGQVFVRVKLDERAIKVMNYKELDAVVGVSVGP